jgi:hypothetical protein
MLWQVYDGDRYLSLSEIQEFCRTLAESHSEWVGIEEIGRSGEGEPIHLLTIGRQDGATDSRPALWIDGGTHAVEWTGVMASLYAASSWVQRLVSDDPELVSWFSRNTVYIVPCVSPDGYAYTRSGGPMIRSTTRPPRTPEARVGLEPQDLTGDGQVRMMRWKHPAGPFVPHERQAGLMRHRRLDDPAESAFFVATEGAFLEWDGHAWRDAPRLYGMDLNRNFPGSWAPFSMFGMDGGGYPLSVPESRSLMDAIYARPGVALAISNHTYTGALLTQPYRIPSVLGPGDLDLMSLLAANLVRGSGYRVIKVHPDFVYDENKVIIGVWADTLSTVLGIPAYTLELWDPFSEAGTEVEHAGRFFRNPEPEVLEALFQRFTREGGLFQPWHTFDHPQLGEVEIGGLDLRTTIRNPPPHMLAAECGKCMVLLDNARSALPDLSFESRIRSDEGIYIVELGVRNLGFLSTSGLARAAEIEAAPKVFLRVEPGEGLELMEGAKEQVLGHLEGWGSAQAGSARHPVYPGLGTGSGSGRGRWMLKGAGILRVHWEAGRAGAGWLELDIPSE